MIEVPSVGANVQQTIETAEALPQPDETELRHQECATATTWSGNRVYGTQKQSPAGGAESFL